MMNLQNVVHFVLQLVYLTYTVIYPAYTASRLCLIHFKLVVGVFCLSWQNKKTREVALRPVANTIFTIIFIKTRQSNCLEHFR